MKKRTKEKFKKWSVVVIILFMALMLVLAYMPMLFVPDDEGLPREESGVIYPNGTSTRN